MIPLGLRRRFAAWTLQAMGAVGIETVTQDLMGGGTLILDTNDHMAKRIRCEEAFEPEVRRLVERAASVDSGAIDIGANLGYYTVLLARLIGPDRRVLAFEPQAATVRKLRRNIARNGLRNVEVFPYALCDREGTAAFNVPPKGMEDFGSLCANGRFHVERQIEVETRRLDDVLAGLGNPKIGLVKIDAEGAELLILRGAESLLSSPSRPIIVFEANEINCEPFGYCVFDILSYLRAFGYRLRQIDHENWIAEP